MGDIGDASDVRFRFGKNLVALSEASTKTASGMRRTA